MNFFQNVPLALLHEIIVFFGEKFILIVHYHKMVNYRNPTLRKKNFRMYSISFRHFCEDFDSSETFATLLYFFT